MMRLDDLGSAVEGVAYALLPGDPGRVDRLAQHLDAAAPVIERGPVVVTRGELDGSPVVIASTGMGGPSTVLTAEALGAAGVHTFLRVGGGGPVAQGVPIDQLVVATGAVRHEGSSEHFLAPSWPAVAHPAVVNAALVAAQQHELRVQAGIVHTKDSFFGEIDPASSPVETELTMLWVAWCRLGVLASEMEAAPLFALATARGWRAGAVVKINDVSAGPGRQWSGDEDLCALACETLRNLSKVDR